VQSLSATPEGWITSTGFKVRYFPALRDNDDGSQHSIWPQKWPIEFLESEQASDPRGFAKNYQNQPISVDGIYWQADNFQYGPVEPCSFTLLSVDPATTSKAQSDYSGVSVIGYSKSQDRFVVRFAAQLRVPAYVLRKKVLSLLDEFPEIGSVLIETNAGSDLWTDPGGAFYNLPNVKVLTVHQDESKTLRAERALLEYTRGRVWHERRLPDLERQLLAFPNLAHDDLVDSLTSGINQIRAAVTHDRNKPKSILLNKEHYR
jgi:phage terminase large subunit-like protein